MHDVEDPLGVDVALKLLQQVIVPDKLAAGRVFQKGEDRNVIYWA